MDQHQVKRFPGLGTITVSADTKTKTLSYGFNSNLLAGTNQRASLVIRNIDQGQAIAAFPKFLELAEAAVRAGKNVHLGCHRRDLQDGLIKHMGAGTRGIIRESKKSRNRDTLPAPLVADTEPLLPLDVAPPAHKLPLDVAPPAHKLELELVAGCRSTRLMRDFDYNTRKSLSEVTSNILANTAHATVLEAIGKVNENPDYSDQQKRDVIAALLQRAGNPLKQTTEEIAAFEFVDAMATTTKEGR